MVEYLDVMDAGIFFSPAPSTPPQRVLAALGPKMLKLAAERCAGAHPYFIPVANKHDPNKHVQQTRSPKTLSELKHPSH